MGWGGCAARCAGGAVRCPALASTVNLCLALGWGSLEPSRRGGENAQKAGKNGGKMGEIRSKTCEQGKDRRDQLGSPCCSVQLDLLSNVRALGRPQRRSLRQRSRGSTSLGWGRRAPSGASPGPPSPPCSRFRTATGPFSPGRRAVSRTKFSLASGLHSCVSGSKMSVADRARRAG